MDELVLKKSKLNAAIANQCSIKWRLILWSRFIRARDNYRCVNCESTNRIQAHHIFRRVVYPYGWFELGNGITLCHDCHRIPHAVFNGRPDLSEPINAKGGDDQDEIAYLYGKLLEDAENRGVDQEEFYFISNKMLRFFVAVQGYEELYQLALAGNITRLRMAHEIWRVMPEIWYTNFVAKVIQENF